MMPEQIPFLTTTPVSHRQNVCEDLLKQGCVESFVHFFQMTNLYQTVEKINLTGHRNVTNPELPVPVMDEMKDLFLATEKVGQVVDMEQYQRQCRGIAGIFDIKSSENSIANPKISSFFHQMCLDAAIRSKNPKFEMMANYNLGRMMREMGEIVRCTQHFERYMQLARLLDNDSEKKQAARDLRDVYFQYASKQEDDGNINLSIQYFLKSLESARVLKDRETENSISKRLSSIYRHAGQV